MSSLTTSEAEAFATFLRAHVRVIENVERELTTIGSPPLVEVDVLVSLDRAPGKALRMFELADAIVLSRSGLTRVVDRMEKNGVIERRTCPSDRRGFHVALTAAGAELLHGTEPGRAKVVREHFLQHLSDPAALVAELAPMAERTTSEPGACT